jgi:hypothetical protein
MDRKSLNSPEQANTDYFDGFDSADKDEGEG